MRPRGSGDLGWVGAGPDGDRDDRASAHRRALRNVVYNRTRSKLEPLVAAGAVAAETIADLAGLESCSRASPRPMTSWP